MTLAEKVLKGDVQAAARLISRIEDESPEALAEMDSLYPRTGRAYIVGVTGAPGVGKSTLSDNLIDFFRRQKKTIGVIAIDPTSALTGGALLGDRVRMQRHSTDPAVFIRSLATRGWVGGLARAAIGAIHIMDALGRDIILVETVGSGQIEIDIVRASDTTLVVLAPGAGDEIQTMKAGILEAADIIVVNKADREGADRLRADLEAMLALKASRPGEWQTPVVLTEAINDKGTEELAGAITGHRDFLVRGGGMAGRKRERARLELLEAVEGHIRDFVHRLGKEGQGLRIALDALDVSRVTIGAEAVGISRAAYEAALSYAKERQQFGQAIAGFQGIQWMLADMATQIDAARLLTYRAAHLHDRGRPFIKEAAMAKVFASEVSSFVTDKALQIHGGYGYIKDYPVERYFRDARITEIYEGTSEIMRLTIARSLLREG